MARKRQVRSPAQKAATERNWTKGQLINVLYILSQAHRQTGDDRFLAVRADVISMARIHYGDHPSLRL